MTEKKEYQAVRKNNEIAKFINDALIGYMNFQDNITAAVRAMENFQPITPEEDHLKRCILAVARLGGRDKALISLTMALTVPVLATEDQEKILLDKLDACSENSPLPEVREEFARQRELEEAKKAQEEATKPTTDETIH